MHYKLALFSGQAVPAIKEQDQSLNKRDDNNKEMSEMLDRKTS